MSPYCLFGTNSSLIKYSLNSLQIDFVSIQKLLAFLAETECHDSVGWSILEENSIIWQDSVSRLSNKELIMLPSYPIMRITRAMSLSFLLRLNNHQRLIGSPNHQILLWLRLHHKILEKKSKIFCTHTALLSCDLGVRKVWKNYVKFDLSASFEHLCHQFSLSESLLLISTKGTRPLD